ncbi:alginate lyase family protein [Ovoidimarina sediminis]|uniref:alginate lyase family protein n=1 Tax=Ovoidimarina sediminis TaxID=3079856 RepID=UPI0029139A42|nr:alginate lyase family protein [Rhodophyticola sp. MJ-SS7]MDU8942357.1 alginate lyase family protein [Rhodophyticola sp. MJ-SS7]
MLRGCHILIAFLLASALPAAAQTSFVPGDVLERARSLGAKGAAAYCPANPNYWRGSLGSLLSQRPPIQLKGLNSRMDNSERIPASVAADRLADLTSSAAAHVMVTGNARVADQLLDVFTFWAKSGAFTQTKSCTRGGRLLDSCTEWRRADGKDLSDSKDFSKVQMTMAAARSAYFASVANHRREARAADHAAIRQWFAYFDGRHKTPSNIYLGLKTGWYWPAIEEAYSEGNARRAKSLTTKLVKGLDRLMLKDGSIKGRTTRGDRALWYHATALGEIMTAMEMARAQGVKLPRNMEAKLHNAVLLYVRALQNPANIDPWAKVALNSTYRPNYQDYRKDFWQNFFGHAWLHIYTYRYPETDAARWLAARIPRRSQSALFDSDTGLATGCIYNAARAARGG